MLYHTCIASRFHQEKRENNELKRVLTSHQHSHRESPRRAPPSAWPETATPIEDQGLHERRDACPRTPACTQTIPYQKRIANARKYLLLELLVDRQIGRPLPDAPVRHPIGVPVLLRLLLLLAPESGLPEPLEILWNKNEETADLTKLERARGKARKEERVRLFRDSPLLRGPRASPGGAWLCRGGERERAPHYVVAISHGRSPRRLGELAGTATGTQWEISWWGPREFCPDAIEIGGGSGCGSGESTAPPLHFPPRRMPELRLRACVQSCWTSDTKLPTIHKLYMELINSLKIVGSVGFLDS